MPLNPCILENAVFCIFASNKIIGKFFPLIKIITFLEIVITALILINQSKFAILFFIYITLLSRFIKWTFKFTYYLLKQPAFKIVNIKSLHNKSSFSFKCLLRFFSLLPSKNCSIELRKTSVSNIWAFMEFFHYFLPGTSPKRENPQHIPPKSG